MSINWLVYLGLISQVFTIYTMHQDKPEHYDIELAQAIINEMIIAPVSDENDEIIKKLIKSMVNQEGLAVDLCKRIAIDSMLITSVKNGNLAATRLLLVILHINVNPDDLDTWGGYIDQAMNYARGKKMIKLLANFKAYNFTFYTYERQIKSYNSQLMVSCPFDSHKSVGILLQKSIRLSDLDVIKLLTFNHCRYCQPLTSFYDLAGDNAQIRRAITAGILHQPGKKSFDISKSLKYIAARAIVKAHLNIEQLNIPVELKDYLAEVRIKDANLLAKMIRHRNWAQYNKLISQGADMCAKNKYGTSAKEMEQSCIE